MTGIPSIVAGLFILAFWVLVVSPMFNDGRPGFSGFAASLALSVLMLPTIARSTEEMLRLVPTSAARGLHTRSASRSGRRSCRSFCRPRPPGIVTGVMLAIARAAGETAPVLLVAGGTASINSNPFQDNQVSLSIYHLRAGRALRRTAPARAWTAALTLVVLVMALTIAAKLLARRNKLSLIARTEVTRTMAMAKRIEADEHHRLLRHRSRRSTRSR